MRDEVENLSFFHSEDIVEKFWRDLRELLTELTKKFVPLTNYSPIPLDRQSEKKRNTGIFFCCNRTTANCDNYKEKEMLLRQPHEMIKRQRKVK